MHLLQKLFERNEKPMSELRRGTDASAAAECRRRIIEVHESAGIRTLRIFAWLCAPAYSPLIPILGSASSRICFLGQLVQERKARGRLADEKPHVSQELDHAHGNPICLGRPNDRTSGKRPTEEWAWLRHDQVGLKVLCIKRRSIKIWKRQAVSGVGQRGRIAGLIMPGLEMHCLSGTDADQNPQDLHTRCSLCHGGVKAISTLFDRRKVECRRVGNCLDVFRRVQIGIRSGDCRKLPIMQVRDCLGKHEIGIKIGVIGAAAVPSPPTGVESELHEVSKPRLSAGAGRGAARQGAELTEMDWLRALRDQVCVKECEMSALILVVVVDVYIHILIERYQSFGVGWIPSSARFFAVLDSSEFVILDPEIGLQDFRRRRESEQSSVAFCDWVVVIALVLLAKHS